jgi:hypothetical protein
VKIPVGANILSLRLVDDDNDDDDSSFYLILDGRGVWTDWMVAVRGRGDGWWSQ